MFRQWVRASAPTGVALEPPGDSGRIVSGVFVSGRVCVLFSRDGVMNQGVVVQPRRFSFRDRVRRSSWVMASVRAVGSSEAVSF